MSQTTLPTRQLVIIDSQVNNWQSLANDVGAGSFVLVLNSSSDGLTQISDYLATLSANADFEPLQSIHIISHGSAGCLLLGPSIITGGNLGLYSRQLATIGNTLTKNGDILLYGCNVAADRMGLQFINQFADLTNSDVASSNDMTGSAVLGGDWQLEASIGTIESSLALSTATSDSYADVLAPNFIITKDDLLTGEDGDTAKFSVNLTTAPTYDVSVTFTSNDLTEGTITNSTLTFNSTNWSKAQNFIVVGQNDYLNDGNISYKVSSTISSNDVNYRQIVIDPIEITNIEDVTTVNDDRIPIGTVRDTPLKIYGDAIVDTAVIDVKTGLFKVIGTLPTNDTLHGLDGNDTLLGGNLQDDLSGGKGDDILYGENDEDFLYGGDGNDTLYGGLGIDSLQGGSGNDVLNGGVDDLMADTMEGGVGDDTYYVGYGANDEIIDNGLDTDIDMVIMPSQLSSYTLPTGIENGIIAEGTQVGSITGNTSNNLLTGNGGNNKIDGGQGADQMQGGNGNDVYYVDNLGDVVNEVNSKGVDKVIATVDYVMAGNIENLDLGIGAHLGTGNSLNNVIKANGDGNDIDGGDGNDRIIGGNGEDYLQGSHGNDYVDAGGGDDEIIGGDGEGDDIYKGGDGNDTVIYTSATTGITVDLAHRTAHDTASGGNEIGTDRLNTIENIIGGQAGDTLMGDEGDNVINGFTGNDTITGGAGNDTFFYDPAANSGLDRITDFSAGDRIRVIGANFGNTMSSGDGSTVGSNQVQLSSAGGITTLSIGANATPGADLSMTLTGTFSAGDFYLNGTDILLNSVPSLTAFSSVIASGNEDSPVTVSLAKLQTNGNEADVDGTVDSFVVKAVSSGTLKIGASAGTAAVWNATTNNSIDATHNAYWTPAANANGTQNAFTVIARDNSGAVSATPVQTQVSVTAVNDAPVLTTPTAINYTDTVFDDSFAPVTGGLIASDIESNTLTYGITSGTDNGDGTISQSSAYGVLTVTKATGAYSFVANDAAIEALTVIANANFAVTVSDGSLSNSKTLAVTIAQSGTTESIGNDSLTGSSANNKFDGLAGADTMKGGLGNDTLDGGTSNDVLTGGTGLDVFRFTTAPTANMDTITDFNVVDDTIQLENAVFSKLTTTGVLDASVFVKAAAAIDFNDYVIYNAATGAVTYDADGSGAGVGVQIAVLGVNLALTHADFVII